MDKKLKIGDFVFCKKMFNSSKTGMVIATKPSNYSSNNSTNCYSTVYYVLLQEGIVEGPLFSSEVTMVLRIMFQLIDVNFQNFLYSRKYNRYSVITFYV